MLESLWQQSQFGKIALKAMLSSPLGKKNHRFNSHEGSLFVGPCKSFYIEPIVCHVKEQTHFFSSQRASVVTQSYRCW